MLIRSQNNHVNSRVVLRLKNLENLRVYLEFMLLIVCTDDNYETPPPDSFTHNKIHDLRSFLFLQQRTRYTTEKGVYQSTQELKHGQNDQQIFFS